MKQRYGYNTESAFRDTTDIKVPLKKFLGNSKTKDHLTLYQANNILSHFDDSSKIIVVSAIMVT